MKKATTHIALIALFLGVFLVSVAPVEAKANGLTEPQIQAVLNLLVAFNVDAPTIANVEKALRPWYGYYMKTEITPVVQELVVPTPQESNYNNMAVPEGQYSK